MLSQKLPEPVLWVNKTGATYNTRTTDEAYAINSHVKGDYARWWRKEKLRRLRSEIKPTGRARKSALAKVPMKAETPAKAESQGKGNSESDMPQHLKSMQSVSKNPEVGKGVAHKAGAPQRPWKFEESTPTVPHPVTVLQKGNSDPFDAASVPLTARSHFAIVHACEIHAQHVWPRSWGLDFTKATADWWFARRITSDAALIQAVLAWSFSQMLTFKPIPPAGRKDFLLEVLQHKSAGLSSLNTLTKSSLSADGFAVALECMLYLGEIEWFARSEAVLTHFRAARIMLDRLGGLKLLSRKRQETVIWDLVNISFTYPIRPLLKEHELDSGSWSEQAAMQAQFLDLNGNQLLDSITRPMRQKRNVFGLATTKLRDMFSDLSEVAMLFEVYPHLRLLPLEAQVPIGHWAYSRRYAIRARLTCLWRDLRDHEKLERTSKPANKYISFGKDHALFQRSLCLCLRMCDLLTFDSDQDVDWARPMWIPYRSLLQRYLMGLNSVICKSTLQDEAEASEGIGNCQIALLWMYFVGSYFDQVIFTSEVSWCSDQFRMCAEDFGYKDLSVLRSQFQRETFYVPTVHDAFLERVAAFCDPAVGYPGSLQVQQRTEEILDATSQNSWPQADARITGEDVSTI